jgi:hypothetical protein
MKQATSAFVLLGLVTMLAGSGLAQTYSPRLIDSPVHASEGTIPHLIRFRGAVPVPQGQEGSTVSLTFSIYSLQAGASPLWSETQKVRSDAAGNYDVLLGAMTASRLPQDLFSSGQALWLGIQPQLPAAGELPRVLLVAVPYALKSADADALGGKPASSYVTMDSLNLLTAANLASLESPAGNTGSVSGGTSPVVPGGGSMNLTAHPTAACASLTSSGAGTVNFLAKFTAACNLEKSLLYHTGSRVGIGTAYPAAVLDVFPAALTGNTGSQFGLRLYPRLNPAANSTAINYGGYTNAQTLSGNPFDFAQIYGLNYGAEHYGTGTVSVLAGSVGTVANHSSGSVSNATGLQTQVMNLETGTISSAYGLKVGPLLNTGGGTLGTYYGVFIAAPSAATTNYAFYSGGGTNYFGGNVGIGTTKPSANLEVHGNLKLSGSHSQLIFDDGSIQTTAGLTGITAGTGLAGGGTTGTVTLAVDPAVVASQASLTAETTRAQGAETGLSGQIAAETYRAEASEEDITSIFASNSIRWSDEMTMATDAVQGEMARAWEAEQTLGNELSALEAPIQETSIYGDGSDGDLSVTTTDWAVFRRA